MFGILCAVAIVSSIGEYYAPEIAKYIVDKRDKKRGWKYNDELDCIDILNV